MHARTHARVKHTYLGRRGHGRRPERREEERAAPRPLRLRAPMRAYARARVRACVRERLRARACVCAHTHARPEHAAREEGSQTSARCDGLGCVWVGVGGGKSGTPGRARGGVCGALGVFSRTHTYHKRTRVHTHTHAHTHTDTHTHTHTHTQRERERHTPTPTSRSSSLLYGSALSWAPACTRRWPSRWRRRSSSRAAPSAGW